MNWRNAVVEGTSFISPRFAEAIRKTSFAALTRFWRRIALAGGRQHPVGTHISEGADARLGIRLRWRSRWCGLDRVNLPVNSVWTTTSEVPYQISCRPLSNLQNFRRPRGNASTRAGTNLANGCSTYRRPTYVAARNILGRGFTADLFNRAEGVERSLKIGRRCRTPLGSPPTRLC